MTEKPSKAPLNVVMMVEDPVRTPVSIYAEKGSTLEWRNDSTDSPKFEIQFIGSSPARKTDKLSGTTNDPVVVHVTKSGKFKYKIRHIKNDGTSEETGPFHFRSCIVCNQ
jgi:hypothetical protein